MRKSLQTASFSALVIFVLASCSTSGKQDEYHDWQKRNEDFISGISAKADKSITPDEAVEGDLFRILQYDMDPSKELSISNYVYCEVIQSGYVLTGNIESPEFKRIGESGSGHPILTDSISIHYRGRLMPTDEHPDGFIFDQSYNTPEANPFLSVPKEFVVSGLVKGMTTALQNMSEGDAWRLYIPYQLGYGSSNRNEIPAYSTLIFDVTLVKFWTPEDF